VQQIVKGLNSFRGEELGKLWADTLYVFN
jgi:hypothetical protein